MRIERYWVETNSRVNYPLKAILQEAEEAGEISTSDVVFKFSVGVITRRVAQVGVQRQVDAWNRHAIRGGSKIS
jgi:hypothetical protein